MNLEELRTLVANQVPDDQPDGAAVLLPMDGIFIVRHLTPSPFKSLSIGPFASLILQGQKEARLDDNVMVFSEGQTSVLGHDVPIEYCVAKGSPEKPFLALLFQLSDLRDFRIQLTDLRLDETIPGVLLLYVVVECPAAGKNQHTAKNEHTGQIAEELLFLTLAFPIAPRE